MEIVAWGEGDGGAASINEVAEAASVELGHIGEDIESGGLLDGDIHAIVDGDFFGSEDGLWAVDGDIAGELDLAVAALGIKLDELVGIDAGIAEHELPIDTEGAGTDGVASELGLRNEDVSLCALSFEEDGRTFGAG